MAEDISEGPKFEALREQFLFDLADFIIEAGQHGWAAGAESQSEPSRPGFKEINYQANDEWMYHDSYAGYFMAPGSSVIYYRERPVWYMTYGGAGQTEEYFDKAQDTFVFLRKALMTPDPALPIRGPRYLADDTEYGKTTRRQYFFKHTGNLSLGSWREWISEDGEHIFGQRGEIGLIIDKDKNRQPIYPWTIGESI